MPAALGPLIYVASSWRNPRQPAAVAACRAAGLAPYDFREPVPGGKGFGWHEIDPEWLAWTPRQFKAGLDHPLARKGFLADYQAMRTAAACLLLLPCGKSAHLEAGWFAGQGKPVVILMEEPGEPELMYLLASAVATSLPDAVNLLRHLLRP